MGESSCAEVISWNRNLMGGKNKAKQELYSQLELSYSPMVLKCFSTSACYGLNKNTGCLPLTFTLSDVFCLTKHLSSISQYFFLQDTSLPGFHQDPTWSVSRSKDKSALQLNLPCPVFSDIAVPFIGQNLVLGSSTWLWSLIRWAEVSNFIYSTIYYCCWANFLFIVIYHYNFWLHVCIAPKTADHKEHNIKKQP